MMREQIKAVLDIVRHEHRHFPEKVTDEMLAEAVTAFIAQTVIDEARELDTSSKTWNTLHELVQRVFGIDLDAHTQTPIGRDTLDFALSKIEELTP